MKKGVEGLHGQECGSRYARMDREGNRLDGRVFTCHRL